MATEPVPVWYTCHICGAILTDHKCLSCDHVQCAECPVYVPVPTHEQLLARIADLESDWKRINRVFKSTSDKTIDQDMKIEALERERQERAGKYDQLCQQHHDLGLENVALRRINTALHNKCKTLSDALTQVIEICKKEL